MHDPEERADSTSLIIYIFEISLVYKILLYFLMVNMLQYLMVKILQNEDDFNLHPAPEQ